MVGAGLARSVTFIVPPVRRMVWSRCPRATTAAPGALRTGPASAGRPRPDPRAHRPYEVCIRQAGTRVFDSRSPVPFNFPPMSTSLVIVESPAKARTIARYLGDDFLVEASIGAIRDLEPKGLAVAIDDDFKPTYVVPPAKKDV